ncbi:hypothetical protein TYRP_003499 [Tyrophagus putrescentiae]|nr:hypothetical protein TYRP_003499 [Tyrophagus putrescentiae]
MKLLIALCLACLAVLAHSAGSENEEAVRSLKAAVARLQAQDAVPQDFVYLQLPREKAPGELWPNFIWNDISRYYAGQFFRVIGGAAAPLTEVQKGSIPYISQVKHCNACPYGDMHSSISMDFRSTKESEVVLSAAKFRNYGTTWSDGISFNWTAGEVRPRNMAYKVWVRR